jgi:hypothetical protein
MISARLLPTFFFRTCSLSFYNSTQKGYGSSFANINTPGSSMGSDFSLEWLTSGESTSVKNKQGWK